MNFTGLIKAVFSTIRTGNLLMICFTLFLIRYTIVVPLLNFGSNTSSLQDHAYAFLVVAVIFIAAGGYMINDYFDTGIDAINKPGKNKIGSVFPKKSALTIYLFLTIAGLGVSWYFGELAGIRYPLLVMIVCAGLLYFYSSTYKKMFLVGNIIIAFLTSTTIFLPLLFDRDARVASPVVILVSAYAVFAFLLTFIREIIKDCEDADGDRAFGASTLPIITGIKTARIIAAFFTLLTFGSLLWVQIHQQQWDDLPSFVYLTLFVQLPLLFLSIKIIQSKTKSSDHFNSKVAKLIMVTGILSMPVFYITSF